MSGRPLIIAVAACLLASCGGSGSQTEPEEIRRIERRAYLGPVDLGPEASPVPDSPPADIVVTTLADAGAGSLRAALAVVDHGQVIGFHPDLAGGRIRTRSTLRSPNDDSFTITAAAAPGLTLDGGGSHRILQLGYKSKLTLIGLGFQQGRAVDGSGDDGEGGAIRGGARGALILRHCRFEGNVANRGGAVRTLSSDSLLVEDCAFRNNDGSRIADGHSAGAIVTGGKAELTVRRSWFEDNLGHVGGAIYNLLQPMLLEDCVFLHNWSSGNGGAVFCDQGNHDGPSATVGGHLILRRCWVQGNHTVGGGGGLLLWANPLDEVILEDCVLAYNVVDRDAATVSLGGGLRTRGRLRLERCAFIGNRVEGQGGACWLGGKGPITISDTTFSDNQVVEGAGGAIFFNHDADCAGVSLRHCTVAGNHAGHSSGAFRIPRSANGVTVTNSIIVGNTAGVVRSHDQVDRSPQHDGGGNLEFPAPSGTGPRVAAGGLIAAPRLGGLAVEGRMLFLRLEADSPAIGLATPGSATTTDARGRHRDADPDSGAVEGPGSSGG